MRRASGLGAGGDAFVTHSSLSLHDSPSRQPQAHALRPVSRRPTPDTYPFASALCCNVIYATVHHRHPSRNRLVSHLWVSPATISATLLVPSQLLSTCLQTRAMHALCNQLRDDHEPLPQCDCSADSRRCLYACVSDLARAHRAC